MTPKRNSSITCMRGSRQTLCESCGSPRPERVFVAGEE